MDIKSEPARVIRMKELAHKISFQPSTIYGLIAEGKFPRPFKLVPGGRAAGWFENTIDDWIAAREQLFQNEHSK
jgi:prophage regulatory protein|tara:strand:- start:227 stop:448 length:222 start_codon:yes stop_codon:yes gene_type:complete